MFGDKAWLTVVIQIHPKGVGWAWEQGYVQESLYGHGFVDGGFVMLRNDWLHPNFQKHRSIVSNIVNCIIKTHHFTMFDLC